TFFRANDTSLCFINTWKDLEEGNSMILKGDNDITYGFYHTIWFGVVNATLTDAQQKWISQGTFWTRTRPEGRQMTLESGGIASERSGASVTLRSLRPPPVASSPRSLHVSIGTLHLT